MPISDKSPRIINMEFWFMKKVQLARYTIIKEENIQPVLILEIVAEFYSHLKV